MYYAVKKGRKPGIYEDKEEALKQIFKFPFNEMRVFEKECDAKKYLSKEVNLFYVVKRGRVPGIYFSKEEVSLQVRDFKNPIVRTFRDEQKAEAFLLEDISECNFKNTVDKKKRKEKRKEDFQKKMDKYLANGISVHSKNVCFIDIEANESKAISLGAIIYDTENKEILNSFYSLMKYSSFVKMDPFCEKINHIKTESVLLAEDSDIVMNKFIEFINNYGVVDIFSWGSNDKHFLSKSLTDKSLMSQINPIRNIQTFISSVTKDVLVNKTWSLQSIKGFYGIEGIVAHNALSDAMDLVKVFECFQSKKEINKDLVLKSVSNNVEK